MNVINTTVLRNHLTDALNEVAKKDKDFLLVAKKGKVTSALVDINFFEDLLALADRKYLASIKKAREEYEASDVFTHDQVFGE